MNVRPLPGHTDEEIIRLARQANRGVYFRTLAVVSVVLLGVVGFFAGKASRDAARAVDNVQAVQVAACEASIRPGGVRFIDAQNIARQVVRSDAARISPDSVARAFGIPRDQAAALLKTSRADQVRAINDLLAVECSTGRPVHSQAAPVPSLRALAASLPLPSQ